MDAWMGRTSTTSCQGNRKGPPRVIPTTLAPTILRHRCPGIVLGVDSFDPRYVVEPPFVGTLVSDVSDGTLVTVVPTPAERC